MPYQPNFVRAILRSCLILAVSLELVAQPSAVRAEPVAPVLVSSVPYLLNQFTALNGKLFFTSGDGEAPVPQLWQSDGTLAGTQKVMSLTLGRPRDLTPVGNQLYFAATLSDADSSMFHLWRTDGSPTSRIRLSPENSGVGSLRCGKFGRCDGSSGITDMGGYVLYFGKIGVGSAALFRSDGTPTGTFLLKETERGSFDPYIDKLTRAGKILFFHSTSGPQSSLWKSDGTISGTQLITNVGYMYPSTAVISSTFYFVAYEVNGSPNSIKMWKSDGTVSGTVPLQLPFTGIYKIAGINNKIICLTLDGELWATDGTAAGSQLLTNIEGMWSVLGLTFPTWKVIGNRLFLTSPGFGSPSVLIATDGSPSGTQRLVAFSNVSNPEYIAALGEGFIFTLGNELWATNGTTIGTYKLPVLLNNYSGTLSLLIGNTLYFAGTDGAISAKLWALIFSDKPDARLNVPDHVFREPINPVRVALDITNFGAGLVQSATLTATLGLSLTYVSDTSGITPTAQGNTLVWVLPNLSALARKAFNVSVNLPNNTISSRYPMTFTLGTGNTASEEKIVEVVAAKLLHLPLVFR